MIATLNGAMNEKCKWDGVISIFHENNNVIKKLRLNIGSAANLEKIIGRGLTSTFAFGKWRCFSIGI